MKKTLFCIIILSILLTGCHKKSVSGSSEAEIYINTSITDIETGTKAPIMGTSFPIYGTSFEDQQVSGHYGIFVCLNGTTDTAHKSNSWNILARHTQTPGTSDHYWLYYYVSNLSDGNVASTGYDHITLTARDDEEETADLYAYAPYIQSAYNSGPAAIPYSLESRISRQGDLMYAIENTTTDNTNLDPNSESPLSATFTFKHAFSLLAFSFKLRNDASTGAFHTGTNYKLSNITVTLSDPENSTAKLYQRGTFNALTGSFNNDGVPVPSLSVNQVYRDQNLDIISASSPATAYLMLVPTDVADDELVFTFTISGQTLQPFYLKASHLTRYTDDTHTTPVPGTEGKLVGGYKYTFNFTLDNYLYFDGFSVGEWTTPVDPLGEQEI